MCSGDSETIISRNSSFTNIKMKIQQLKACLALYGPTCVPTRSTRGSLTASPPENKQR